jgi:flagellar biosynthesis protein FlhA
VSSPLDLTGQIISQFSRVGTWVPVTGILSLLAVLPGMPHVIVLLAAALAGSAAWKVHVAERQQRAALTPVATADPERTITWHEVSDSAPVTLELGYALVDMVDQRSGAPLMARITGIRRQISRDLGFVLPLVRVKDNLSLPGNAYRIEIAGIVMGEDEVWPHDLLALDSGDIVAPLEGRAVKDPSFNLDAVWIEQDRRAEAIVAGYTVVDASTVIATHLSNIITGAAAELFGLDDMQALLDTLKASCPQLAQGLCPQPYTLSTLMGICRALLSERVPLRDFRRIAEALVGCAGHDIGAAALTELVRQKLGALIVQSIVPHKMALPTITFDTELETMLAQAIGLAPDAVWPIDPALARRIVAALKDAVEPLLMSARAFAVVTSPQCRPAVSRLLRAHIGDVQVLSYLEIPETKAVDLIATVGRTPEDTILPSLGPAQSQTGA